MTKNKTSDDTEHPTSLLHEPPSTHPQSLLRPCKKPRISTNPEVHISQLPDEILLYIFSFINPQSILKFGLVCRRWYGVASESLQRIRVISLQSDDEAFEEEDDEWSEWIIESTCIEKLIKVLNSIGNNIESVHFSRSYVPWSKQMEVFSLLQYSKKLKMIRLEQATLSYPRILEMSTLLPDSIDTLMLGDCENLREYHLKIIISKLPHLQKLVSGIGAFLC